MSSTREGPCPLRGPELSATSIGLSGRVFVFLEEAAALIATVGALSVTLVADVAHHGGEVLEQLVVFVAARSDIQFIKRHGEAGIQLLMLVVGVSVGYLSWQRLLHPTPTDSKWAVGAGAVAALVLGYAAVRLLRARRYVCASRGPGDPLARMLRRSGVHLGIDGCGGVVVAGANLAPREWIYADGIGGLIIAAATVIFAFWHFDHDG